MLNANNLIKMFILTNDIVIHLSNSQVLVFKKCNNILFIFKNLHPSTLI